MSYLGNSLGNDIQVNKYSLEEVIALMPKY